MTPRVTLYFDARQDFYHFARLHGGLSELATAGAIHLEYRPPPPELTPLHDFDPTPLFFRVTHGQISRLAYLDLHDMGKLLCPEALDHCDIYFKRSLYPPDLASLGSSGRGRVRPFGLNYGARTRRGTLRLLTAAATGLLRQGLGGFRRVKDHVALPLVSDFEQPPDIPLSETIVFQTRVWEPGETEGEAEAEAVNEPRVALVRALRKAFGDRFRGGLVPTSLARARYPDVVTTLSSRRKAYCAMSKRNLVGVCSRGLFHSTPFKLPEYIAGSQCVVAEPPRNELPEPLVEGVHYLGYSGVDQCLAACDRLLTHPPLAALMRRANHEYYRARVRPDAHVMALVEETAACRDGLNFR